MVMAFVMVMLHVMVMASVMVPISNSRTYFKNLWATKGVDGVQAVLVLWQLIA